MAIQVACACGQQFAAHDNLAGKTVRCPQCQGSLQIPPVATEGYGLEGLDSFDQSADEERFCPKCKAHRKPGAIVCVKCGYNWRSRRQMQTRRDSDPEPAKPAPVERTLESEGAPAWVYAAGLIAVIAAMVAANYAPPEILIPLGLCLLFGGALVDVGLAVAENPANFLLVLFTGYIYGRKRAGPFIIMMCGILIAAAGALRSQKRAEPPATAPPVKAAAVSLWDGDAHEIGSAISPNHCRRGV